MSTDANTLPTTLELARQRAAAAERAGAASIIRGSERPFEPLTSELVDGLHVSVMLGPADGSVHLEIAVSELEPGGSVAGHIHPFEESFYMLSGAAVLSLGGQAYAVRESDFGFAPIGSPHAWRNTGDQPARWLRVRAPQPRPIGEGTGTYAVPGLTAPETGRDIVELDPFVRFLGHFSDEDMPAPGPLAMPGYHGHNVRGVSIRMMVDEILGAQHHAMFMVEFTPSTAHMPGAKEHFHPFEEMFYFLSGHGRASSLAVEDDVKAGDLLFLPVNASHGISNPGDTPVRWIEVQAPKPPSSDAFFFEDDWRGRERG